MNKAFAIILVASMTGGCALMEGNYGKIDVFAFPVYWRCSEGERKTSFLGPKGLLGVWSSTTNGVEYIVIPSLFTYYEPGKTFDSPLFSWSEEGTFKVLMTGRGVHNSFTNICITPFIGMVSGTVEGEWLFPVWDRWGHVEYDSRLALLDGDRLPDASDGWWHSERKKKLFLLFGEEGSVTYSGNISKGKHRIHRITHTEKQCYIPLACEKKRWADYDVATRKKLADGTCNSLDFLIGSYERKVGGVEGFDRIQWGIPDESWPRILCYKSDEKNGAEFSVFMRPIWQEHSGAKPRNAEKKGTGTCEPDAKRGDHHE